MLTALTLLIKNKPLIIRTLNEIILIKIYLAFDLQYCSQRYLISFVVRKEKRGCVTTSFFCARILKYYLMHYF